MTQARKPRALVAGTLNGDVIDFELPDAPDPRGLQVKFHSTVWEADIFTRRLFQLSPAEVWCFMPATRSRFKPSRSAVVLERR